jgi:hypothetical protein
MRKTLVFMVPLWYYFGEVEIMNTILSELWHGNLEPVATCGMGEKEMRHLVTLMEKNSNRLQATLNEEEKNLLEKYIDNRMEYELLLEESAFSQGFSLAVQMLCESFSQTFSLT